MQNTMKTYLQAQVANPELWDILRAKFEKPLTSVGSCRDDAFRKRDHDDHKGDDAKPGGEKSMNRQKTSKGLKSTRGSSSKQLYGNTEERRHMLSLHNIHVVPFPEDDLEENMNRWVRKEFKTFNEEARLSIQH
ncbi:hypothetical protein Tco_1511624 [Tanacetum coccineum]